MGCYAVLKQEFDSTEIHYNELGNTTMELFQTEKTAGQIRMVLGFNGPDDTHPWLKSWSLGEFPKEKTAAALIACNNVNKDYRWIRFYLDDENSVVAAADLIVDELNVVEKVIEMVFRMASIIDAAYPVFMKARWA